MFGPEGWMNFFKGVGKMALVGGAVALVMWPRRDELLALPALAPIGLLQEVYSATIELLIAALIVYAFIAAADFAFQRHQFIDRNKMSQKEIKDEFKDTEGDPMVRAKLRQIRQERAQRRMMARVPDAAVVITNPTHYAVALEYVQGVTGAPVCVAKGVDEVALRIRELAEANGVPIVEDPPLARGLYASVDLEEAIPPEQFAAVAKVIGYVLSLKSRR
jgi:flagellar biosynthetic protein FlhB